jgi:aarF domain-containing kinase
LTCDLDQIELIDFGATRSYSKEFIDNYLALLLGAVKQDEPICKSLSIELGYLTGEENQVSGRCK